MNLIRRNTTKIPAYSIWDDFFGKDWLDIDAAPIVNGTLPAVNIKESADEFDIDLAAPGLKREDFKIDIDDNLMTIVSEKKEEHEDKGRDYRRKEFSYQSFKRSFNLPEGVDSEKITATYNDGILNINLPKREEAKVKPSKTVVVS